LLVLKTVSNSAACTLFSEIQVKLVLVDYTENSWIFGNWQYT